MGNHPIFQDIPASFLPHFTNFEGSSPRSQELANASSRKHLDIDKDLVSLFEGVHMHSILVIVPLLTNLGFFGMNSGYMLDFGRSAKGVLQIFLAIQKSFLSFGEQKHE